MNFAFDEIVEFGFVDVSESVEAGTADYLFFESLVEIGSFFGSDQDINAIDFIKGVKKFL